MGQRNFVVWPGLQGKEIFEHALKVQVLKGSIDTLLFFNKITKQESENLYRMLDSPDKSNIVMVEMTVNFKQNE